MGTFPSEDAAAAWAAIDRLAHDLVADGTCSTIEQARGKALTDLVISNATIDVQIVLAVPADGAETGAREAGSTAADHREATAGARVHGDDLVQVQGARPSEPMLVRRDWVLDHLANQPRQPWQLRKRRERARSPIVPCDQVTGARLDPDDDLATDAYRPTPALAALVRARDGRCRFPGCSVAARFCDLDHVRPWPTGPTAATNLITLCRRHHRVKQRPGWRVRLAPDGTTTWTDPTGRQRTTAPLDALETVVLRSDSMDDLDSTAQHDQPHPPNDDNGSEGAWSALEARLAIRLEHHSPPDAHYASHRRCTSSAELRNGFSRRRARAPVPDQPPF